MTIQAKVIADSVAAHGGRITTLQLRYPRFIHAELLTHRSFSRNASSSRAVPLAKMIEQVERDPAGPTHWGRNEPGMQSRSELGGLLKMSAQQQWEEARQAALKHVRFMATIGVAKQLANRLLEPFSHIDVVVTSTDFTNFFALRDHPDAQPEMQSLARAMKAAIDGSTPDELDDGQWHTPYVTHQEYARFAVEDGDTTPMKLSTARCARVSYLKHDQTAPNIDDDLKLYDRLVGSEPRHASPCEHQATPFTDPKKRSRNFVGWLQYRELVEET
jgi:hypothetical protein